MELADLLKKMDSKGVSLVQLQGYKPTTGKTYACTVGWFRDASAWASSCANGDTQEAALEAAMRSTGLFPEMGKKRRDLKDMLE